jgi:hypothetical protein
MLKLYGISPFGDLPEGNDAEWPEKRSYFQKITLLKTVPGDDHMLRITSEDGLKRKSVTLTYGIDYTFRMPDQSADIEAPVVFAGYGFIDDSSRYNDFRKLNVKGRYILRIAGFPAFACKKDDTERAAMLRARMEARYRSMGVAGVLEYDPDSPVLEYEEMKDFDDLSPSEHVRLQGRPHSRYSIPGKRFADYSPRIQISARAANELLNGTGSDPDTYRAKADRNEETTVPVINGASARFSTTVKTGEVTVRNVLGIIEGKRTDRYVVAGAHYDHLGIGNGMIWNGADDNGSGTVGVMTMAKAASATGEKPEYSIVFAFWTAEEEGLLGSRYWVRHLPFPTASVLVNLNYDMISRYITDELKNKVTMTYTASRPVFRELTEKNLKKHNIGLDIDFQPSVDPPGGTDHRAFVEAGIPVIRIKPGHREEYHTPMDEVSTVSWDIMEKIVRIGFANMWELANGAGDK